MQTRIAVDKKTEQSSSGERNNQLQNWAFAMSPAGGRPNVRTTEYTKMIQIVLTDPDSVTREEFMLFQSAIGYRQAVALMEEGRRRKRLERGEQPIQLKKEDRQEKLLPHEDWHALQQKQGRVEPTLQMKTGTLINEGNVIQRSTQEEAMALSKQNANKRKIVSEDEIAQVYKLFDNSNAPEQAKNGIMVAAKSAERNATYSWQIKPEEYNGYVKEAQKMLRTMGYKFSKHGVDGKWISNGETYNALLKFQESCKNTLSGVKQNGTAENQKQLGLDLFTKIYTHSEVGKLPENITYKSGDYTYSYALIQSHPTTGLFGGVEMTGIDQYRYELSSTNEPPMLYGIVDVSGLKSKPEQLHHFATNKSKTYTPKMKEITNKYGLDLDKGWNKEYLQHQGRHPNEYHDYILENMKQFDNITKGDKNKFLDLYNQLKQDVIDTPEMLTKQYWK